jgi:hypothetical protein
MSSFTINILVLELISVYYSESNTQQVSLTQSQSLIWTPRKFSIQDTMTLHPQPIQDNYGIDVE